MGRKQWVALASDPWLRFRPLLTAFLCLLITVGCGGSPADPPAPSRLPPLQSGTVAATSNPLVAQYTISTPAQATMSVEFGPDLSYAYITSPQASSSAGGAVTILVAGMKQNTLYHMRGIVTYSDGSIQFDGDHTFQTGTIPPQRIPTMKVTTA